MQGAQQPLDSVVHDSQKGRDVELWQQNDAAARSGRLFSCHSDGLMRISGDAITVV
jgi:hypothetical protein